MAFAYHQKQVLENATSRKRIGIVAQYNHFRAPVDNANLKLILKMLAQLAIVAEKPNGFLLALQLYFVTQGWL